MLRSVELAGRTVAVHGVSLSAPEDRIARFRGVLSPDERDRAGRFRFQHLQDSFVLARGALRVLLSRYLGADPASIAFEYAAKGKPGLAPPARLRFNLSHSGGVAIYAFTLDCEVGIDVEAIRPVMDMESIARRMFGEGVARDVMSLSPGRREAAFFRHWTRMEACGKASGDGLSEGYAPGGPYTVQDLDLSPEHAAAVAYVDDQRPLQVFPLVEAGRLLS
jgi:4'-phosphopantetheinyl transferase